MEQGQRFDRKTLASNNLVYYLHLVVIWFDSLLNLASRVNYVIYAQLLASGHCGHSSGKVQLFHSQLVILSQASVVYDELQILGICWGPFSEVRTSSWFSMAVAFTFSRGPIESHRLAPIFDRRAIFSTHTVVEIFWFFEKLVPLVGVFLMR